MAKKLTFEVVKKYIEDLNCILLSEKYINSTTPLKIQCECGEVFERKFKIIQKSPICKCKKCTQKHVTTACTYSYEDIKIMIEKDGHKLLTKENEYTDTKCKIKVQCPKGHINDIRTSDCLNGHKCKKCGYETTSKKLMLKYEEVKKIVEDSGDVLLSEEFKGVSEKIEIQCGKCNHVFTPTFNNYRNGSGCPKCAKMSMAEKQRFDYNFVKEYIESFGYKLLSFEYLRIDEYLSFECPIGHKYEATFGAFKNSKNRCPYCNNSRGEEKIRYFLEYHKMEYVKEKRFAECRGKAKPLPFDFYLPYYNICIEYDGKQHFHLNSYSFTLLDLMNRKYLDNKKSKYCKDNNIKLIRIPYWDFDDIEKILELELNL